MNMRMSIVAVMIVTVLSALACQSRSALGKMAVSRIQKVVEREFSEKMGIDGGLEIKDVESVYDCDSLCMVQCMAVYADSAGTKTLFPLRYVLVRDVFMSMATGRPVYNEGLYFSEILSKEQMKAKRREIEEHGSKTYE